MTRHVIDDLVFDVTLGGGKHAMRDEAYLSRLVTATMLPVVEEVFDDFDDGDTVLVLPLLELDLGAMGQADYENTAPQRLRAALDDALHRALAAARQRPGAVRADGDRAGAMIMRRADAELHQLQRFLDTGTMPWHVGLEQPHLHEALLARLLTTEGDSAALRAVLAGALADPRSARRLVEQFPRQQLLAILRAVAGDGVRQFESLLTELDRHAWLAVLAAGLDPDGGEAAACARIGVALAPIAQVQSMAPMARVQSMAPMAGAQSLAETAQAQPMADVERLLRFLASGVLHGAAEEVDQREHEVVLERLLAAEGDAVCSALVRALAGPRQARRFVEQFSEAQRIAVLRGIAGAGAAAYEALIESARNWPPVEGAPASTDIWMQVITAITAAAPDDAEAHCARIRAASAPREDHIDTLARPLGSDAHPSADGARSSGHEAPLARAQAWPGGAESASKVILPTHLEADATSAGTPILAMLPPGRQTPSDTELLLRYLDEGVLEIAFGGGGPLAHEALLSRVLDHGGDSLWPVLARSLSDPRRARRFVMQFSVAQRLAVLRGVLGAGAAPYHALLDEAGHWPSKGGEAALTGAWMQLIAAITGDVRADAETECARIRAACAPSQDDTGPLAHLLDGGAVPPTGDAILPPHEALMARLLTQGGDGLRALLVAVFAKPGGTRRFVAQYPAQLLAILRAMAGMQAHQFEAALAQARAWPGGEESAWEAILPACLEPDAMAACARILAPLAPRAQPLSDTELLLRYLDSGVLELAVDGDAASAHEILLGRLMTRSGDALWPVLARCLSDPRRARRFVTQFPASQRLAVLYGVGGADAARYRALLDEAGHWPPMDGEAALTSVWMQVIAAITAVIDDGLADAEAQCARIRAALAPQPQLSAPLSALRSASLPASLSDIAPLSASQSDIALLAHYLDGGVLPSGIDGIDVQAPQALLDRLLTQGGDALWTMLSKVLVDPRSARRLVERFPAPQRLVVLRGLAGTGAQRYETLLAEAVQWSAVGAEAALPMVWMLVLAGCAGKAPAEAHCARVRTVFGPSEKSADGTATSDAGLLAAYLDSGQLPANARDAGSSVHIALLARLLRQGGDALRAALAPMLAAPNGVRRLVTQFPQDQRLAVLRAMAGKRASQFEALLAEAGQWLGAGALETTIWVRVLAVAVRTGDVAGAETEAEVKTACMRIRSEYGPTWKAAPLARQRELAAGDSAPAPAAAAAAAAAPGYQVQLRHFAQFIDSGVLQHASAMPDAHLALLDDLIAQADDQLWRVIARALARDDSAARLLAQFPQRQWVALIRASAPGYAPSLERMLQRRTMDGGTTHPWWRHTLAACVARPSTQGMLRRIGASMALAGVPVTDTGTDTDTETETGTDTDTDTGTNTSTNTNTSTGTGTGTSTSTSIDTDTYAVSVAVAGTVAVACTGTVNVWSRRHAVALALPWRSIPDEREAVVAMARVAGLVAPMMASSGTSFASMIQAQPDTAIRVGDAGLALHQRARMARTLLAACRELEAGLQAGGGGGPPSAGEAASVRAAIAAQMQANSAIAPPHRQLLKDAIDAKSQEAADSVRFLRGVLAALKRGEPLDLDAVAEAPASPWHLLAAALKRDDVLAARTHWQTLRRSAPRLRAALHHYGRSPSVQRALAGAPAVLRAVLAPAQAIRATGPALCQPQVAARAMPAPAQTVGAIARAPQQPQSREQTMPALAQTIDANVPALHQLHAGVRAMQVPVPTIGALVPAPRQAQAPERAIAPAPHASQVAARAAMAAVAPVPADTQELVLVANAGMVLASPYLPRLFSALNLTVDGVFVDELAAGRAVHLLQYMVTGEAQTPEYLLVLNKILCGLPTAAPVPAGIDITQTEQDTIEGMVQAMVTHAKVLGSCSLAAMRQTFFARKADLQLADDAWQLRVHPGTFDMLLDRLPWGYSIVKFGWMARPVHVEWRHPV